MSAPVGKLVAAAQPLWLAMVLAPAESPARESVVREISPAQEPEPPGPVAAQP